MSARNRVLRCVTHDFHDTLLAGTWPCVSLHRTYTQLRKNMHAIQSYLMNE
jgi:hypothetical protein